MPTLTQSEGLPASVHTEIVILGASMLDADALAEATAKLRPEDLSLDSHRKIFSAISSIQGPVDYTTLRHELERRRELEAVGGPAYLAYLTEGIPRNLNIESYVRIVKDKALARELYTFHNQGQIDASDPSEDTRALIEQASERLRELLDDQAQDIQHVGEYLVEPEKMFEKLATVSGIDFGYQDLDEMIGGAQPGDLIVIAARPSMGKALKLDEPVLTTRGWKPNALLEVGDHLASIDGGYSQVTGIFPQGERQMYRVQFSDGRLLEADGEHLWEIYCRHWPVPRVLTTLKVMDMLSYKRYQGRIWIETFKGCFGEDRELPLHPYALGAILGNGGLSTGGTPKFSSNDPETIQRLRATVPIGCELRPEGKYNFRIVDPTQTKNRVTERLRHMKLLGAKSCQKFIPKEYLSASRNQRLQLMRGLMDTDGNVEKWGTLIYSTSSLVLAHDVVALARSLGCIAKLSNPKIPTFTYKGERRQGLPAYRITICHRNPAELVSLKRKQERTKVNVRHCRLTVVSVTPAGIHPCQCITVSHPSRLYVASHGYVVTHNSALACCMNWNISSRGKTSVLFSLEQKRSSVIRRMLSSAARIDYKLIRDNTLRDWDKQLLMGQIQALASLPLYIDDTPSQTATRIRSKCERLRRRVGLDIAFIDQLSHVSMKDCREKEFRLKVGEQTKMFKRMALEMNIPVVVFNQLKRGDDEPKLSDLKESGNIEEDADVVIFPHRPEYYDRNNQSLQGLGQFIVAKNREGATGTIDCTFQGRIMRWGD